MENKRNQSLPGIVKIIFLLIGLLSLLYAFCNRRLWDVVTGSLLISGVILFITVVILRFTYYNDRDVEFRKENFLSGLGVIVILGVVFYSIYVLLEDASKYKQLEFFGLHRNWLVPLAGIFVLTIGVILFYFRLYLRSLYGLAEVVVGVFIGVEKVSEYFDKMDTSDFYLIMLTASVYLIVRGLDNMHQGFSKEPYDLIAKKLIKEQN